MERMRLNDVAAVWMDDAVLGLSRIERLAAAAALVTLMGFPEIVGRPRLVLGRSAAAGAVLGLSEACVDAVRADFPRDNSVRPGLGMW